jgi:hypothetical protein
MGTLGGFQEIFCRFQTIQYSNLTDFGGKKYVFGGKEYLTVRYLHYPEHYFEIINPEVSTHWLYYHKYVLHISSRITPRTGKPNLHSRISLCTYNPPI